MIVAGVDIGSLSSKAVVIENSVIKAQSLTLTGPNSTQSATTAMDLALKDCNLSLKDIDYIVGTGYGRVNIPFAQHTVTEISCHAKGNHWLFPETRTILDMGGQDCKTIRCNEKGNVTNFTMNDKCAAGTGRYLERVAAILGLQLKQIGPFSLEPIQGPCQIRSHCLVFAENDIINLVHEGKHTNDILAGVMEAIVDTVYILMQRVGIEKALCISGGIAKNIGVVSRLEKKCGLKARIAAEPQIVGAIGAALFALDYASPKD